MPSHEYFNPIPLLSLTKWKGRKGASIVPPPARTQWCECCAIFAKAPTLLHPATCCKYVRNLHQECGETYFHFIKTDNIINPAPLHGQIVTVVLCEFPKLTIIASNNIIFRLVYLSIIVSAWKFSNICHAHWIASVVECACHRAAVYCSEAKTVCWGKKALFQSGMLHGF